MCESTGKRCRRPKMKNSIWCYIHTPLCSGRIGIDENYRFWNETAIHGIYDRVTTTDIINLIKDIEFISGENDDICIVDELYKFFKRKDQVNPLVSILKVYLAASILVILRKKHKTMCFDSCHYLEDSYDHLTAISLRDQIAKAFINAPIKFIDLKILYFLRIYLYIWIVL